MHVFCGVIVTRKSHGTVLINVKWKCIHGFTFLMETKKTDLNLVVKRKINNLNEVNALHQDCSDMFQQCPINLPTDQSFVMTTTTVTNMVIRQ